MRVVENHLLIGAELVDGRPTAFALPQLGYRAVSSRKHRRVCRRDDVDRIVCSSFSAARSERVNELVRTNAGHRNDEALVYMCYLCWWGDLWQRLDHR